MQVQGEFPNTVMEMYERCLFRSTASSPIFFKHFGIPVVDTKVRNCIYCSVLGICKVKKAQSLLEVESYSLREHETENHTEKPE